ncbi:MAG TPA: mechanosensitive ion channel family protein, partial [Polyangiaceae bacterium]|nr:mechanosensitive ion channel family protein [Polyangiaceae bacterium]
MRPARWLHLALLALVGALLSSTARADPSPSFDVRLHEHVVFSVRLGRAEQTAQERARLATRALQGALEDPDRPTARVEEQPDSTVVFVGKTPIVTLGEEDAEAAGGGLNVHVYAAGIASKIDDELRAERKRSAIAENVLSVSLVVFTALLAFLALRQVRYLAGRARAWVGSNPHRIPALKLGQIEVVRPLAVRGAVSVALALGQRIAEFTIAYVWLIIALSRFEATRSYTDRLAGFVLVPLSALIGRLGAALPLFVVAAIAAVSLGVAVRFVELFFVGVARGETHLAWLPRDLAGPTSV